MNDAIATKLYASEVGPAAGLLVASSAVMTSAPELGSCVGVLYVIEMCPALSAVHAVGFFASGEIAPLEFVELLHWNDEADPPPPLSGVK